MVVLSEPRRGAAAQRSVRQRPEEFVSKRPFPYATASGGYFFPQDGPLGLFAARILEAHSILPGVQSMWRQMMRSDELPPPTVLELLGPFASLALTDMVVSFETYLRNFDATLRPLLLRLFPHWPAPRPSDKPYGFFFYDLDRAQRHFRRIFGVSVFYRTPLRLLRDWVQMRHLFAHANGVAGRRDVARFRYYRVLPGRRLLIAAEALNEAARTFQATATTVNNRIGAVAARAFLRSQPSLRWSRARSQFVALMRALTYFGTIARTEEHSELMYRLLVAMHARRRESETGLPPAPRPVQPPWPV